MGDAKGTTSHRMRSTLLGAGVLVLVYLFFTFAIQSSSAVLLNKGVLNNSDIMNISNRTNSTNSSNSSIYNTTTTITTNSSINQSLNFSLNNSVINVSSALTNTTSNSSILNSTRNLTVFLNFTDGLYNISNSTIPWNISNQTTPLIVNNSMFNISNQTIALNETNFTMNLTLNETNNGSINYTINFSSNTTVNTTTNITLNTSMNSTINITQSNATLVNATNSTQNITQNVTQNSTNNQTCDNTTGVGCAIQNTDEVTATPFVRTTYIYVGTLAASITASDGKMVYYMQDQIGSNRKLTDTNLQEGSMDTYAFGEQKGSLDSLNSSFRFTGKEFDDESGLYYYGSRYYAPELGRFMQADAQFGTVTQPDSLNRYAYTLNNPMKYNDPTGNDPQKASVSTNHIPQAKYHIQDSTFTANLHRYASMWYDSKGAQALQTVQVITVDSLISTPTDSLAITAAYFREENKIIADNRYKYDFEGNLWMPLFVGHEGGHAVIFLTGQTQLPSQAWTELSDKLANSDPEAVSMWTSVVKRWLKYYDKDGKATQSQLESDLGNELISEINRNILAGNPLPDWMIKLSTLNQNAKDKAVRSTPQPSPQDSNSKQNAQKKTKK